MAIPRKLVDCQGSIFVRWIFLAAMKEALIGEGLCADEADALLNTWELSYFKSPGLRFFFMVPRAWADRVLPLEVSPKMEIRRALVGRIEIVTPDVGVED